MTAVEWAARLETVLQAGTGPLDRLARLLAAVRGRPFILFGAGYLGRWAAERFRRAGAKPLAFADNNPRVWGTTVAGLRVVSLADAVAEFGPDVPVVVTVYTSAKLRADLASQGRTVVPFAVAALEYGEPVLPHAALEQPASVLANVDRVREGLGVWADESSREEYVAQVRYRLTLTDDLPPSISPEHTYFPDELILPRADEVFVDCGAYDGDSVRAFLARRGSNFAGAVAIEADPGSCGRLRAFRDGLPREVRDKVRVVESAVGATRGTITFEVTGTAGSHVTTGLGVTVPVAPLDDILAADRPTYIKMDIEGAEPDAIRGAAGVLCQHKPVLAICLYHRQNDLWEIPLALKSLVPEYELFLRRYSDECWEQVVYAVPADRVRR